MPPVQPRRVLLTGIVLSDLQIPVSGSLRVTSRARRLPRRRHLNRAAARFSFDALRNALFESITYPLGATKQRIQRNTQLLGQRFSVFDFGAPFFLIVIDDQEPVLLRQSAQAFSQTNDPQIVIVAAILRRRGDRDQFFQRSPFVVWML